jgi:hypothetical protein
MVPRSISKASRSTHPSSAIIAQRAGRAGGSAGATPGLQSEPPADPPVHARSDCYAPHRPAAESCALEAWSGGSSSRPVPRSRAPRSGRDPSLDRPRQPFPVTYQSPGGCPGASGERGSGGRRSRGPPSRPGSPRRRHSAGRLVGARRGVANGKQGRHRPASGALNSTCPQLAQRYATIPRRPVATPLTWNGGSSPGTHSNGELPWLPISLIVPCAIAPEHLGHGRCSVMSYPFPLLAPRHAFAHPATTTPRQVGQVAAMRPAYSQWAATGPRGGSLSGTRRSPRTVRTQTA